MRILKEAYELAVSTLFGETAMTFVPLPGSLEIEVITSQNLYAQRTASGRLSVRAVTADCQTQIAEKQTAERYQISISFPFGSL